MVHFVLYLLYFLLNSYLRMVKEMVLHLLLNNFVHMVEVEVEEMVHFVL